LISLALGDQESGSDEGFGVALLVVVEVEVVDDHTGVDEEGLLPQETNCIATIRQVYGGSAPSSMTSDGGVSVVLQNESLPLERAPPDMAQVPSFGGMGDFVKTP